MPPVIVPEHRPDDPAVSSVSLKLPPFWTSDPEMWFQQMEAQFRTRRITAQRTKFDHIVATLSPEFASEVRDFIIQPPTDNPYTALREQLIKQTTASEQRKQQQLFSSEELGDKKPTQMLRRIQQLLGEQASTIDTAFLKELFLQCLPPSVRMILASTSATSSLADLADKTVDIASPTVLGIQQEQPPPPPPPPQLGAEVD